MIEDLLVTAIMSFISAVLGCLVGLAVMQERVKSVMRDFDKMEKRINDMSDPPIGKERHIALAARVELLEDIVHHRMGEILMNLKTPKEGHNNTTNRSKS